MRISNISIKNFKRFTDLTLEQIPDHAKLVLLIGSNGSGKSCVFDAFDYIIKGQKKPSEEAKKKEYYLKNADSNPFIKIDFGKEGYIRLEGLDVPIFGVPLNKMPNFIGRSSIRIVPQITIGANPNAISNDADSPESYIQQDTRFLNDVYAYIQNINQALREPVFSGKAADTLQIFRDFIEPLNSSLLNILGGDEQTTIQIAEFQDATLNETAKLIFKKGQSKINYDLLSHGEKQIVILLLNFIVRQKQYEDAIIFIDEMDCHLNTSLQSRLLKEIVERWVPDSAQLWTATHALGFIEYAKEAENACVLDFDLYDFDQPQVIRPSDKTKYEIFEIAVSKEFIDKIFQGRRIVFSENTDAPLYNNLSLDNTFFFTAIDKTDVFHKAKNLNQLGLIDRDFLSDDEVIGLKEVYSFLNILPYYSIENLLFHPDNLAEYYQTIGTPFNREAYIDSIRIEKKSKLIKIVYGIGRARDGYPFFKENNNGDHLKKFRKNWEVITNMLESDDFETFYKVFPAKDYGTTIQERQNLQKDKLVKTQWFAQQISSSLNK